MAVLFMAITDVPLPFTREVIIGSPGRSCVQGAFMLDESSLLKEWTSSGSFTLATPSS